MLVIVYTDRNDRLKRAVYKGQNTDQYMLKGNYIQWYELDGQQISFMDAMNIIHKGAV